MPNLRGKTWTTTTPANVGDAQYWEDHLISDADAAKISSSVQTVNGTSPDAQGNVDVVALPDGGTVGQVLTKQSSVDGDADWEDPASSGHTIEDEDGNTMPYQSTLQFENAEVTNDSVNNKTIVDCKGSKGDAATITVGTVTTLPAGSDATVTNSGTSSDAVFDFGIPKGADGAGAVDSVNGYTGVVVLDASDVGALPDSTTIPTKTSELDNDSGFVTSSAIPTSLSELSDDATHRLVTDAEKNAWDAKVSESLLKSTVGWTGKNKFDNHQDFFVGFIDVTNNKFVLQSNYYMGIVPVKPNTEYIITKQEGKTFRIALSTDKPANNVSFRYTEANHTGTEITVTTGANDNYLSILFWSSANGDSGTYQQMADTVMIRDASITDDTYEPYHESVEEEIEQIYADNGVLGAKNLYSLSPTHTFVKSTARIFESNKLNFKQGDTINVSFDISDVANFGGTGGISVKCIDDSEKDVSESYDYGLIEGRYKHTFTINTILTGQVRVYMFLPRAEPNNNATLKLSNIMVYLGSDPDDTYVPYAMTNRELTEDTQELKYRVGILSSKVPYYVANATMPRKKTLSSAELTEARARAAEQDYKTVVPGDIVIGPNTGSEYYLAKCWGRKGVGDSQPTGGASLTPNLMLMLYKPHGITRLWAGYGNADKSWRVSANDLGRCPWNAATDVNPTDSEAVGVNNTNITRAYDNDGTSVNVSGYMGSFIRKMIDERLLVDCFEADFGAANILPYRSILGNAIKTDSPSGSHPAWNGLTNGWTWYTRKLDLPGEIELYGSTVWGSSGFDVGIQNEQLPFLKLGDIDLFFPRFDIWTKAVASGSYAAYRSGIGFASSNVASFALWACPLGCIK